MILKVRRKNNELETNKNPDNWILMDGFDRVDYQFRLKTENIGVRDNVIDLLTSRGMNGSQAGVEPIIAEDYFDLWLYKGDLLLRQVLAHGPIYILNDEGKTIERI
jgi:hypothetical protein